MRHAFTFEVEPFEFQPEFKAEYTEEFDSELSRQYPRRTPRKSPGMNMSQYRARTPNRPQPQPRSQPTRTGSARRDHAHARCVCPQHKTEFVRWVQHSLNQVLGLQLPVSGVVNPETRSALRRFQKERGLPEDGIAGPETEKALIDAKAQSSGQTSTSPAPPAKQSEWYESEALDFEDPPSAQPILRRGSRGTAVVELQNRLTAFGFDPGTPDGIFGSQSESAVKSFQRARSLPDDGIVGPQTWAQLYSQPNTGGYPPIGTPGTTTPSSGAAARIVVEAQKHLGYQEGPNNQNIFSAYFGVPNVVWCTYFVSYVHTKAGIPLNLGSSDAMLKKLGDERRFFTSHPSPGDVVIFDWTQGDHDPAEHVGIVESVNKSATGTVTVNTIEGNASNGVNRRSYPFGDKRIVGFGRLWAAPGATPGTPSAPAQGGSAGGPQVTISTNVVVSDNAVRILKEILRAAGLTRATITSGRRTPDNQARIMYELIERHGVSYAKNLYGSYGGKVIDVYDAQKKAGKSATQIKSSMTSKIRGLGPQNVSRHCSDAYDVIDVAPSSIADQTAFRRALDSALKSGTINKYIPPPQDPAFHIEIKLSQAIHELMAEILHSPPLPLDAFVSPGTLFEMD